MYGQVFMQAFEENFLPVKKGTRTQKILWLVHPSSFLSNVVKDIALGTMAALLEP